MFSSIKSKFDDHLFVGLVDFLISNVTIRYIFRYLPWAAKPLKRSMSISLLLGPLLLADEELLEQAGVV